MSNPYRIYVVNLSKHNNGDHDGTWLAVSDYTDAEELQEAIDGVSQGADWAIHDYDGGPALGEGPTTTSLMAVVEAIEAHGETLVTAWIGHHGHSHSPDLEGVSDAIADADHGVWDSPADWAEDFLESTGALAEVPAYLRSYIDFEAYARDAELGGDMGFIKLPNGTVWAISNH